MNSENDRREQSDERGERSTAFSETKPPQKVTVPPPGDRQHRAPPTDGSEGESGSYADKREPKGS